MKSSSKKIKSLRGMLDILDQTAMDFPSENEATFSQHMLSEKTRDYFQKKFLPDVVTFFIKYFSRYGFLVSDDHEFAAFFFKLKLSPIDDGFHPPKSPPSKVEEKLPVIRRKDLEKILQFISLSPVFSEQLKKMTAYEFRLASAIDAGMPLSKGSRNALLKEVSDQGTEYHQEILRIFALSEETNMEGHFSNYHRSFDKNLLKRCRRTRNGTWYYHDTVTLAVRGLRSQMYSKGNSKLKPDDKKIGLRPLAADIASFMNDVFFLKYKVQPKFSPSFVYQVFYEDTKPKSDS